MSHRSGLGFSTVETLSSSEHGWKERLGRIAIFLCLLVLLGILFSYIDGATHKIGFEGNSPNPPEVGWDITTQ